MQLDHDVGVRGHVEPVEVDVARGRDRSTARARSDHSGRREGIPGLVVDRSRSSTSTVAKQHREDEKRDDRRRDK